MARLRRLSCNSGVDSDYLPSNAAPATICNNSTSQTRTSPRKKAVRPCNSLALEDDVLPIAPIRLAAKDASAQTRSGRQIRLLPLDSTSLRSAQAGPRPCQPINSFDEPTNSRASSSPSRQLASNSPAKARLFSDSVAGNRARPITALETKVDVEESLWCGSDHSAHSSDADLPSPRTFVRPAKKSDRRLLPETSLAQLDQSLKALTLSFQDDKVQRAIVPASMAALQIADSEYSNDSDKDTLDRLILRFSPPRLYSPRKQWSIEREGANTPPPQSPTKGRLLSPSKRKAHVPSPRMRPSLDGFWNAETVNNWNDQYSPRKEWQSPRKLKQMYDDASTSPTSSPRKCRSPGKRTKAEMQAKQAWEVSKHETAEHFLAELDQAVTGGKIAELASSTGGVKLNWSKTLNSTAGRANWKRETTKTRQPDGTTLTTHKHFASIELAEKVIDDEARLLNVVAHEFCHLCNFMISGIKNQPHGQQFKAWGRKVTAAFTDRGVEVTTKHTYEIEYKYVWQCENEMCGAEFKRHSKSIDPKRHTCGSCRGRLVQTRPVPRKEAGGVNGYAAFVKRHFADVRRGMPGASQKEVMEAVARRYRTENAASGSTDTLSSDISEESLDAKLQALETDINTVARKLEFVRLADGQ